MIPLEDFFAALAHEINNDPLAAALRLDSLADELHARAVLMRGLVEQGRVGAADAPGGMGDRVQMAVRGPDGLVTRQTDTQGKS